MQPTDSTAAKLQHRADIQGLRAVAILSVLLFHADVDWLPGGFVGVDIFFVISGFLMTKILTNGTLEPIPLLRSFYLSRVLRIVPAYTVVLCITTIAASVLLLPGDFRAYQDSLSKAAIFLSNQYFSDYYDYFGPTAHEQPLLHTWSLAIEVQFYLLYPLAVIFMPRQYFWKFIFVSASLFTAYVLSGVMIDKSEETYYHISYRIPEFLIGAVAAYPKLNISKQKSNFFSILGAILVSFSFTFIPAAQHLGVVAGLPACIGSALLIITRGTAVHKLIETKPMQHIGDISYEIYLWHWPIFVFIRYYYQDYEIPSAALIMATVMIFLLSRFSHQLMERAFSKNSKHAQRTHLKPGIGLATISVLIVILAQRVNGALDTPLPIEMTRYADPSLICHGQVLDECYRGDSDAQSVVLLMGDSHAAQLKYFADLVGQTIGIKFIVLSASGCVPIPNFDIERISTGAREPCLSQTREIQKILNTVDGIMIAGMWTNHTKSRKFLTAFENFLSAANLNNLPIALLSQPPHLSIDPQRIIRFTKIGLRPDASIVENWISANLTIQQMGTQYARSTYIDTTNLLLFSQPPLFNGNLIYHDEHHLNEVGARLYGYQAAPLIEQWLSF